MVDESNVDELEVVNVPLTPGAFAVGVGWYE